MPLPASKAVLAAARAFSMVSSLKKDPALFVVKTSAIAVELSEKSATDPVTPLIEDEVKVLLGFALSSNLSMFKSVIRVKDIRGLLF